MKVIALISSLDTKEEEILYARDLIRREGLGTCLIDLSIKDRTSPHADITAEEVLAALDIPGQELQRMDKAGCIQAMGAAAALTVARAFREGRFDGILCIGGGQNAKMAAGAMKGLPVGVPKMIVSPLISGKRTLEQFVGTRDIFLLHSLVDFSGLNAVSRMVIRNSVQAMVGMVLHVQAEECPKEKRVGMTLLGVTSGFAAGVVRGLDRETVCFHANGTGGRCFEEMIADGRIDVALDANMHELTCELLGGYCTGAPGRLSAAARTGIPVVCVPGAIDVIDYYFDDPDGRKPEGFAERKKSYHNANICHTKAFPEEMRMLGRELATRLNRLPGKTVVVVPLGGFCEAGRAGGDLYDPVADQALIEELKGNLDRGIVLHEVAGNINDPPCVEICIREVARLMKERKG